MGVAQTAVSSLVSTVPEAQSHQLPYVRNVEMDL